MNIRHITIPALAALVLGTGALAQGTDFPQRNGERPQTTEGVPHIQIGAENVPDLSQRLLDHVAEFPGVVLAATRVSLPGATGFQLVDDLPLAHPEAIVGGREFAHLHPDGSLHAALAPETAVAAVAAGWATPHPWATRNPGWEGFVLIYTPTDEAELETVLRLVDASYTYVTGQALP